MTSSIESLLFVLIVVCVVFNTAVSIYGVLFRPSLVKKLIALIVLGDSANILAILVGFRLASPHPRPPILDVNNLDHSYHPSAVTVDPIPQALVLTAIVIGLAIYLAIASLIINAYRLYGTTDVRKMARLKG